MDEDVDDFINKIKQKRMEKENPSESKEEAGASSDGGEEDEESQEIDFAAKMSNKINANKSEPVKNVKKMAPPVFKKFESQAQH